MDGRTTAPDVTGRSRRTVSQPSIAVVGALFALALSWFGAACSASASSSPGAQPWQEGDDGGRPTRGTLDAGSDEGPGNAPDEEEEADLDSGAPVGQDPNEGGTALPRRDAGDIGDPQVYGASIGKAESFDVVSWNVEWFGDPTRGPVDDDLQTRRVSQVLAQSEAEVWGLVEVVDGTRFHGLARSVANSATLLSSDSVVTEGPTRYGSQSQKLGLVYKTDALRFRSARLLATDRLYDFVGRPPLEARFTLTRTNRDITVVVVHLKADADPDSWQRRNACARWLKGYLDGRTEPTFVVGDFNDTLEGSLTPGQPSPFTPLTETRERYFFPTEVFGIVGISTQVSRRRPIDHHLVTHPLFPALVPDSAAVWRLDGQIARFGETVSDHYPVVSRYAWDRLAAP